MEKVKQFNYTQYKKGNVELKVERVNNDINGNPLYRIYPQGYLNDSIPKIEGMRRNNKSKYYTAQSYSIDETIQRFFEAIDGKKLYMNFRAKTTN